MDIEKLIQNIGPSEIDVSDKKTCNKVHNYLPVPNDFKLIWVEMNSYGGYPAGLALTDKGIIFKAPRGAFDCEEDKKSKKNISYQYIPWEYYDPEGYDIREEKAKDEKGNELNLYSIYLSDIKVTEFYNKELYSFFNQLKKSYIAETAIESMDDSAFAASMDVWGLDNAAFNAAYGADNSKTGHGIYAEKAGVMLDRLNGEQASHTGGDNAKNGPDKIVNGIRVQCKYCKTAKSSVNNCFTKDTKTYRYIDPNGKPMMVEVPKDQWQSAVEEMKKKILNGQVPGVTNPNEAYNLVRKGKLTYAQVKNLAKAGTIESLTYDAATGVISCAAISGVSAIVSFSITLWQTKDPKKAAAAALETGLQVFGPAFVGMILASQIARTSIPHALIPATQAFAKMLDPKVIQTIVNAFRTLIGKKAIYGAAAQNTFAKALRSTVLSQAIIFCVTAIPDTYRVIDQKISGSQYLKNIFSSVGSLAGGFGTSVAAGKIAKKALDGHPVVAKIVGTGAAMVGGLVGGIAVKGIGNLIKEDDLIIYSRMFNGIVTSMCVDYILSESEVNELIECLDNDSKSMQKVLKSLNKSEHQYYDIERYLTPHFESIVKKRSKIEDELVLLANVNEILEDSLEGDDEE